MESTANLVAGMWGLLGPAWLEKQRRVRSLGVGAAVRAFNELAVPGLGGVWFGRQLCLAALGIEVAQRVTVGQRRPQNTEVANAIEALGCWLDFRATKFQPDARLRGINKLKACEKFPTFAEARRRSFYVTQPMRMATVQSLRALGLVEGTSERFNAYRCTDAGRDLAVAGCGGRRPFKRDVVEHLSRWVAGEAKIDSPELHSAISPTAVLPQSARDRIRERLVAGGTTDAARRKAALCWVTDLNKGSPMPSWGQRPAALTAEHWQDLRAGAYFFQTRDSALRVLDTTEAHVGVQGNARVTLNAKVLEPLIGSAFEELRTSARAFVALKHDPTPGQLATKLCTDLTGKVEESMKKLVSRDGVGLRLSGTNAVPGPAFRGGHVGRSTDDAPEEEPDDGEANVTATPAGDWPIGISMRMRRLYWLDLDLRGELDAVLRQANSGGTT